MPVDIRYVFALAFGLTFACSSSNQAADSLPDGPPDASVDASNPPNQEPEHQQPESLADACQALVAERAAFSERCGPAQLEPDEERWYVDSCVNTVGAPGSLVVVSDLGACAAKLRASACTDPYPTCAGYEPEVLYPDHDRKGTLAPGADCFAGLQCDTGYCSALLYECGSCQRPRPVGETCDDGFDLCMDGQCSEGACHVPGANLGEKCIHYGPNGGCHEDLFCGSDGTCTAVGEAGAACHPHTSSSECAQGLFCSGSSCAAKAPNGASCEDSNGCISGACLAGKCVEQKHDIAEGEDCTVGFCRSGLRCDEADRRCKPYVFVPEGGTCRDYHSSVDQCDPDGLYCDVACVPGDGCDETGICKPKPGPGEHCTSYGTCADGAACVDFDPIDRNKSRCVKFGARGDACPCGTGLECIDARCAQRSVPHCD